MTEDERKLVAAVGEVWRQIADGYFQDEMGTLEYWDFCELGLKTGLLVKVPYDPNVHGEIDADPGDLIYTHSELGLLLLGVARLGRMVNGD